MTDVYEGTAQLHPTDGNDNVPVPLLKGAPNPTPYMSIRRTPEFMSQAGERFLVLSTEQIDNEVHEVGDDWMSPPVLVNVKLERDENGKITGLDKTWDTFDLDPRRTLAVMVEIRVIRVLVSGGGSGLAVVNRGWNLDNIVHHGPFETFRIDRIPQVGTWRYETQVRFGWADQYLEPGAKMEVLPRGMVQAWRLP